MKILSEKTNKYYDTVDECIAAEAEYDAAIKAEEERQIKLAANRKERARDVEEAYQAAIEAQKVYKEKLNAFCKDYGTFHMSIGKDSAFDLFHLFF